MAELYSYKRYEKSLGLLTTRFVSLLKKAKDGVLDLKIVSDAYIIVKFCTNVSLFEYGMSSINLFSRISLSGN